MKLIVCIRDDIPTLQKGDVISVHEDGEFEGKEVGYYNALSYKVPHRKKYLKTTPFAVLNLSAVTAEDVRPIFEDYHMILGGVEPIPGERKWKLNLENLERRNFSEYENSDQAPTKRYWRSVIRKGKIRRDTFRAYNEIVRPDLSLKDILMERK